MTTSDEYFINAAAGTPTADGRFEKVAEITPLNFAPGLTFRPVLGERVLVNHVHFDTHTEAPTHSHEEEQVVVVLEGEFEFWIGDDIRVMRRGDVAVVPPWVPHGARTGDTTCLELDIFSPPRRQLLAALRPGG